MAEDDLNKINKMSDSVQPKLTPLEAESYYHGFLPRNDANSLITLDGDFLLRTTEIASGDKRTLCLSIRWNRYPHHVIIREKDGKYGIDPTKMFSSLSALVNYYRKETIPIENIKALLKNPILTQHHAFMLCPLTLGTLGKFVNKKSEQIQIWELKHSQIKLIKKLGEGAFGEVHYGQLSLTPTFTVEAAVKLLKCGTLNKEKIDEMMTEARMMRNMRHPNIVLFYGVANKHEPLMIIMEFMKSGALNNYLLSKGNSVTIQAKMSMACDAALGLQYVHKLGIMHRYLDIASRNCLYDDKVLKLSDFGLSRKGDSCKLNPNEKAPVKWLAPEVNKGYRLQLPVQAPAKIKEICERIWAKNIYERPTIDVIATELLKETGRLISEEPKSTSYDKAFSGDPKFTLHDRSTSNSSTTPTSTLTSSSLPSQESQKKVDSKKY
ncbi:unnamed protein product [Dracunculus medinensis]|uniref:Tyrosine-protein kinase n=1 Tax=Dracunculus medinensis TaxID=318479 RepID=A0A0N4U6E1_DRAME|nr:unnamed protein product [Dracunculus medinensis]